MVSPLSFFQFHRKLRRTSYCQEEKIFGADYGYHNRYSIRAYFLGFLFSPARQAFTEQLPACESCKPYMLGPRPHTPPSAVPRPPNGAERSSSAEGLGRTWLRLAFGEQQYWQRGHVFGRCGGMDRTLAVPTQLLAWGIRQSGATRLPYLCCPKGLRLTRE